MAYFEQHSSTLTFILIWKEESFWNFSLSYGTKIRFSQFEKTHAYIVPTQTWKACYRPFLGTTSGILWSIGILWSASVTKRGDGSECGEVFSSAWVSVVSRGDLWCCGEIRESGIRRGGYLQMTIGLGSRIGHGKRKGHGAKYFNEVLEKRQVCSEKKYFVRRVSKCEKSALICTRERCRHCCKWELQ